MGKLDILLKHIDPRKAGIEVAPYYNPALPKSKFGNVLVLDVFDTQTLRDRAAEDPLISDDGISQIEPVDLVGDASSIADLVKEKGLSGKIHFVVSSHNFEHLPNPIRFLRGCSEILVPGGVLSMAVPDCRACFDIFRMPTRLSDWLVAYHTNRSQPAPETMFDAKCNAAVYTRDDKPSPATRLELADPAAFTLQNDMRDQYSRFVQNLGTASPYEDTHCTVMFPETVELMLRDLRYLGLIDLDILEVSKTRKHEFFIHLRKPLTLNDVSVDPNHLAVRQDLLRRISASLGSAVYRRGRFLPRPGRFLKALKARLKSAIGAESYRRLSLANKRRRERTRT